MLTELREALEGAFATRAALVKLPDSEENTQRIRSLDKLIISVHEQMQNAELTIVK